MTAERLGGRYRYVGELGRGGEARVLKVWDEDAQAMRAAKALPTGAWARLRSEERALFALAHPGIVGVHGLLRSGRRLGAPWHLPPKTPVLIEDWVRGRGIVEDVLGFAPDDPRRWQLVLGHFLQAAAALAAMHRGGWVHGDVSPGNLKVTEQGKVMLLDLGAAGPSRRSERAEGTPPFMAPEAWLGHRTPAVDVFSLGETFAFLLGTSDGLGAGALPEVVPAPLKRLVDICRHRNPSQRFPHGRAVHGRLREVAGALGIAAGSLLQEGPSGQEQAMAAQSVAIVGRDNLLEATLEAMARGPVVVVGPSGSGTRRFVQETVLRQQRREGDAGAEVSSVLWRTAAGLRESLVDLELQGPTILCVDGMNEESVPVLDGFVRRCRLQGHRLMVLGRGARAFSAPAFPVRFVELGALAEGPFAALVEALFGESSVPLRDAAWRCSGGLPGRLVRVVAGLWREGSDPRQPSVLAAGGEAAEVTASADVALLLRQLRSAGGALPVPQHAEASRGLLAAGLAYHDGGLLVLRQDQLDGEGLRDEDPWPDVFEDAGAQMCLEAERRKDTAPLLTLAQGMRRDGQARATRLLWRFREHEAVASQLAVWFAEEGRYDEALALPAPWVVRAEVLRRAGRGNEAASILDRALARSGVPRERAAAAVTLGWLALGQGDLEGAAAHCSREGALQAEVRAWVALLRQRPEEAVRELERAIDASPPRSAGEWPWKGRLFSSLGTALKALERWDDAERAYGQALSHAEPHSQHLAAGVRSNLGALRLDRGELGPGLREIRRAAESYLFLGRERDAARVLSNLAMGTFWLGDTMAARAYNEQAREAASRGQDREAEAAVAMMDAALFLTEGAREKAFSVALRAIRHSPQPASLRAQGALLFVGHDPERAEELLGEEIQTPEAMLVRRRLALHRGERAEAEQPLPSFGRWELRLDAALFQHDLAQRWGSAKEVLEAAASARRLLDAAARTLEPAQRRSLLGRSRFHGVLGAMPGSSGEDVAAWKELARWTGRLADCRDEATLGAQVVAAALALIGAERACLVERDAGGELHLIGADGVSGGRFLSRSVLASALDSAEVVSTVDAQGDEALSSFESINALALRSVLCAPLPGLRAGLYLDDRQRPAVFGDQDKELLRSLGVAAANALRALRRERRQARALTELEQTKQALRDELGRERLALAAYREAEEFGTVSPRMQACLSLARRVAGSRIPVLIEGASGVGKERLARYVHRHSPRSDGPWVAVHCGAVAESLLDTVLFGHERGAFSGAEGRHVGLFEAASGGTLFLDGAGEMSLPFQAKVLRVLQEGEFRRLGGTELLRVDVRCIASTATSLSSAVEQGRFREDLYYRLAGIVVQVPRLAERREDLPMVLRQMLPPGRRLSPAAFEAIRRHPWPGNLRELEHALNKACLMTEGQIEPRHLFGETSPTDDFVGISLKDEVAALEERRIREALKAENGNVTQAAKRLGLSRYGLQKKLKRIAEN